MTKIIGLLGRAGSGKTTCAVWMSKYQAARKYSMAFPLKLIAQDVMDFKDSQIYGSQVEKMVADERYGFSARGFLQRLGIACRVHLGEDVWARACLEDIRRDNPGGCRYR